VRREDKHEWERRVPLTPDVVADLVRDGIEVVVQPSPIRAFPDAAYREGGARVDEDLSSCKVVFAVKEIPQAMFHPGGAYVFFSHTIKGQAHNMPMLRRLMELGCTLIDYERIVDADNRRLVFFGRHAGLAGMVDTLAVTGQRLASQGIDNPFSSLRLTHRYADLESSRAAMRAVGETIRGGALAERLAPFVVGFAGYGNVSRGAQEIFDELPVETVAPGDLAALASKTAASRNRVFKVVFEEKDLVVPRDPNATFDLGHYYAHGDAYRGVFARSLAHLSVLVNGIYWTPEYPRLVSKADLAALFSGDSPRLVSIGDIGCDIDGAIECTVKATTPAAPAFVYDPASDTIRDGVEGPGVVMMTTDCLPCELSREASLSFTEALRPFVAAIAATDFDADDGIESLPPPVRTAVILWRGELTPPYAYLREHVR
jgi:alpha-aminoadipic semialdehyde synthase